jgi:hypothetical protein
MAIVASQMRRGKIHMRTLIAAGLLALGGLMTTSVGVANADEVQVEGVYSTEAACLTDGPHVELQYDDGRYTHYACREGSDGLWYLYLNNG